MSAEARIAKLESLLERIAANRTDAPVRYGALTSSAAAEEPSPPQPDGVPPTAVVAPTPSGRPTPTPMERAISGELEIVAEPDEPEIEIGYDDDEPILTIEEPAELDVDAAPTAPVHTRSPEPEPEPEPPAPTPRRIAAPIAEPSAPVAKVVARAAPRTFGELLDRALRLRPR